MNDCVDNTRVGGVGFTSTGIILVLFILLVIILRTFGIC